MRDDIGILNRTPVLEPRVNGLPTPLKDSAHAGFTAVNTGDAHSAATFRHDSAGTRPITLPPVNHNTDVNGEHATMTRVAAYNAHSWRPIDEPLGTTREDLTKDSNTSKRKRADSPADASSNNEHVEHLDRSRVGSPKRRQIDEHHDDVSSRPGREDHQHPIELRTDPDHRQVTPDQPAPAPRPDAGDQVPYVTSQPQGRPSSSSGPDTDQTRQASFPRGSENPHGVDDKNKRKRNFSNRTKTGCHTCRTRKKKCDEGRPRCQNCIRGSFECGGYGPKPLGGPKAALKRAEVPLQAKHNEAYPRVNGQQYGYERSPYVEHPPQPGPTPIERYNLPQPRVHESHPSRHPPPHFHVDTRLPPGPESWQNRGHAPYDDRRELPPAPHYHPPEVALPAPPPHMYPASLPPPPPPPPRAYYEPSYPPPSHMYRPGTATAHTVISSRESVVSSGSGSYHSGLPSYLQHSSAPVTARSKMLRGERYTHFQDTALRNERISCRKAVEAYNDSCKAVNPSSSHEQERNFLAIYEPRERAWEHGKAWDGPSGSVGSHAVVETPFNCEFGYNIHLGKDVLIQQNCTLQDASIIYIGDRSIIGPNVKFYCITTSVDAEQRRGSRGDYQAGPIRVEEDVYIGADSIILPFRTIGKGAVVGAGSVVTRDVKPHTVVAGNPAKPIRKRKIESGPNADRHSDEIEEQNQEMLRKLQNNEVIPRDD